MMTNYVAMLDNLQCMGVSVGNACAYATTNVHEAKFPTFYEVYGRGALVEDAKRAGSSLNVVGLNALDLTTAKPDGTTLDFTLKADRKLALHLIEKDSPYLVILAPPCTSFCKLNRNINYRKMPKERVDKLKKEGLLHLHFAISIALKQLRAGKHFLFEHPRPAVS